MFNIKNTFILIILFQFATAFHLQLDESECPATGISFLPHYSNCSLFFECLNGNKELLSCPSDYAWSITKNQCVHENEADCSYTTLAPTPSDGVTCPATGLSYLPHYGDCKLFFECLNGNKLILSCPADYAWSISKIQCVHEDEADCSYTTLFPTTIAECPADGISYLPVYSNCKQYFRCDNGIKSIHTCSDGYAWNIVIQACNLEELVDCSYTTVAPITTTVAVCPADELVYLPVSSDCKKYVRCDYGVKTIQTCADGYAWSIIIQACDLEELVDCGYTSVTPTVTPPLTTITTPRTTVTPASTSTTSSTSTTTTTKPPVTTVPPLDNICIGQPEGAFFPHPTDCTKYIECTHNRAIEMNCGKGTTWDQDLKTCDTFHDKNCKQR